MNALFQALHSNGEVGQTARWALSKSPFIQTYVIAMESVDGPLCVCLKCFHRFEKHKAMLGEKEVEYWACRLCHGIAHVKGVQKVVALLTTRPAKSSSSGPTLVVNWFERQAPFDFDEVWLEDADDFQVEEFVVKIRNDLDGARRKHYRSIPVYLSSNANPSQARINLLKDTFGKVEARPR